MFSFSKTEEERSLSADAIGDTFSRARSWALLKLELQHKLLIQLVGLTTSSGRKFIAANERMNERMNEHGHMDTLVV